MTIDLTSTNASKIASALLLGRRHAGSPAMGMVLTLVVVADEGSHYDALKTARSVSREHPSRILGVIRRSPRGASNLDAEVRIGEGASGETVLLRMSGELTKHAESVVLPLLLPDSPVVVWWPGKPPDDPATDPLGALAQRRITDTSAVQRGKSTAMLAQATNYADGNTDLSWTRLTPWRALLAAALDQYPAKVSRGSVAAERVNPSAELLVAWLSNRLHVPIERNISKGPGITSVALQTGGGEIEISRPDGTLAQFTIPNAPPRPVALRRREVAELLAEELRRLDPDDVYEATVKTLCRLASSDGASSKADSHDRDTRVREVAAKTGRPETAADAATDSGERQGRSNTTKKRSAKGTSSKSTPAKKTAAKKRSSSRRAAASKS